MKLKWNRLDQTLFKNKIDSLVNPIYPTRPFIIFLLLLIEIRISHWVECIIISLLVFVNSNSNNDYYK